MNFIKKVFDKKTDESVHLQFQKFGKGEFRNRAIIVAKQSKGKFTIFTSAEFAKELVRIVAEKLGDKKTKITGAIVSTNDLTGKIDFTDKKQFQGVKRYLIEKEMSGNEIIKLLNEFPKTFFALSFACEKDNTILKIKPKAPKSGKPGSSKEEKLKADFCKIITEDKSIGNSFVFETPEFSNAEIEHTFLITDLILPKGESDFAKMREMAKRKGKIIRVANIDGKKVEKIVEFEA